MIVVCSLEVEKEPSKQPIERDVDCYKSLSIMEIISWSSIQQGFHMMSSFNKVEVEQLTCCFIFLFISKEDGSTSCCNLNNFPGVQMPFECWLSYQEKMLHLVLVRSQMEDPKGQRWLISESDDRFTESCKIWITLHLQKEGSTPVYF